MSEKPKNPRNVSSVFRRLGFFPEAHGGDQASYDKGVRDVIGQDPDAMNPKMDPTIVDLRSIPSDATDEYLIQSAAKWLKVLPADLYGTAEDSADKEISRQLYEKLDRSVRMAHDYLLNVLKIPYYKDIVPPSVTNHKELIALLRKTVGKETTGLSTRALYCALISTGIAAMEAQENVVEDLIGEAGFFEQELIRRTSKFHLFNVYEVGSEKGDTNDRKFDGLAGNPDIKGTFAVRGKTISSFITKWLARPETSAETALKDGIAMRITVSKNSLSDTVQAVTKWMEERFGAHSLKFENDNLLSWEEFETLKLYLRSIDADATFGENEKTSISSDRFSAFKIVGSFEVPEGGNYRNKKVPRRFEVQFVLPHNKNERKTLNHYVYDVVRKVAVMTRLLGSCEKKILDEYIKEAAERSGMTAQNIFEMLTEPGSGRLIEHHGKTRQTGKRFVVSSIFERRRGFDIDLGDDLAVFGEVLHRKPKE